MPAYNPTDEFGLAGSKWVIQKSSQDRAHPYAASIGNVTTAAGGLLAARINVNCLYSVDCKEQGAVAVPSICKTLNGWFVDGVTIGFQANDMTTLAITGHKHTEGDHIEAASGAGWQLVATVLGVWGTPNAWTGFYSLPPGFEAISATAGITASHDDVEADGAHLQGGSYAPVITLTLTVAGDAGDSVITGSWDTIEKTISRGNTEMEQATYTATRHIR